MTNEKPSKSDILAPLNPEQRKAALHTDGVAAFNAGPGTGKTTAQVACAALKVMSGMEPQSIAMITFTNKAAGEMQERLVKHIDEDAYRVFVGTFHQLAIKKILRPFLKSDYLVNKGYTNGFNILDKSDGKTLIREAKQSYTEAQTNQLEFAKVDEDFLSNLMTKQKAVGKDAGDALASLSDIDAVRQAVQEHTPGEGLSDNQVKKYFEDNYEARLFIAIDWWQKYQQLCIQNSAMDFDDLLVNASKLLNNHPEIAQKLGRTFQHIQVDEYQDTSPVQFNIVKQIVDAQHRKSAIVVGDMRQAIYGFRGADSASMKTFVEEYNADVYPMNRNYRTAAKSIAAINQFGETMASQLTDGKLVAMSSSDGDQPEIKHFESDKDEAEHVVGKVNSLLTDGVKPNEIAIIYRTKSINKEIKSLLDTDKVQYDVIGDVDFYSTKEVKIAIALLRLMVNENDRFALHNIMSEMPIGITKMKLAKDAAKHKCSQMDALRNFVDAGSARSHKAKVLIDELEDISNFIPTLSDVELAASKNLNMNEFRHRLSFDRPFAEHIKEQQLSFTKEVAPMFGERLKSFFTTHVLHSFNNDARKAAMKKYPDASEEEIEGLVVEKLNERTERVTKLTEIFAKTVENGVSFKDAVDEIMLLADNTKNNKDASIKLMTGHAAKGLEFDHVFFIGAEQETFFRDEPDDKTRAEEERLLYVGVTRHREALLITHCDTRFVNGQFKHYTPLDMLIRFKGKVISEELTGENAGPERETHAVIEDFDAALQEATGSSLVEKIKSKKAKKRETNPPQQKSEKTTEKATEVAVENTSHKAKEEDYSEDITLSI